MKMKKILLIISVICAMALMFSGCGKTETALAPTEEPSETIPPFIDDTGDFLYADKFSFCGGTGKVGISCESVTFNGEEYNALIVLDSDSYTYVRVGETKYNCSHEEGKSWAAIPVTVNENNTIYAETTKMSQPHEIKYEIFIYIKGEADKDADPYALMKTTALDEEAPFVPGFEIAQTEAVQTGDNYRLFSYANGIQLLEVKMHDADGAVLDAFDYAAYCTKAQTIEDAQANRYTQNVVKYILAPEGTVLPAGIEKEAIVVTVPAANIYSGPMDVSPKTIVEGKYDLILLNSDVLSDGGEAFESFAADAASLGVPVVVNQGFDTSVFSAE